MATKNLYDRMAAYLSIDLQTIEAIGEMNHWSYAECLAYVIRQTIVQALRFDNHNFDPVRFYRACGLTDRGEVK